MLSVKTYKVGALDNNIYLVYGGGVDAAVIDASGDSKSVAQYGRYAGYVGEGKLSEIKAEVARLGKKVTAVLLTHGHWDHVADAYNLQCEGAKIYIAKEDAAMLYTNDNLSYKYGFSLTPVQADVTVADGDKIAVGDMVFTVMATPGHTKGSVTYQIENAIFTGDTLFSGDFGRTDLPSGSFEEIKKSIFRLFALEGDFIVYPGHAESSTLQKERNSNSINYMGGAL